MQKKAEENLNKEISNYMKDGGDNPNNLTKQQLLLEEEHFIKTLEMRYKQFPSETIKEKLWKEYLNACQIILPQPQKQQQQQRKQQQQQSQQSKQQEQQQISSQIQNQQTYQCLEINFNLKQRNQKLIDALNQIKQNPAARKNILEHFQKLINQKRLHLGNLFFQQKENYLPNQRGELTILDGLELQDNSDQNKAMINIMKGAQIQYELIPEEIETLIKYDNQIYNYDNYPLAEINANVDKIFLQATSLNINYSCANGSPLDENYMKYIRLIRLFYFFMEQPLPTIQYEELDLLAWELPRGKLIGLENMANLVKDKFIKFTDNTVESKPKGVVFYGPPRTGKTVISTEILKILKLFKLFPDITPSDFNNELVGQAEKMVNKICERSEVVPWQLCILFLDEIDGIAPSRSGNNGSNSKLDLTNLFLTIIDGNKKKQNLLTWGTTNRLTDMDKAFCDRLDIKIFHGIPNFEARKKFYDAIVNKFKNNINYKDLIENDMANQTIINFISQNTINFSSDAIRQSMETILLTLNQNQNKQINEKLALIQKILIDASKSYQTYFGSQVIPEIPNIEEIQQNFSKELHSLIQFQYYHNVPENAGQDFQFNPSPVILVDLEEDFHQQVQFMVYRTDEIFCTVKQDKQLVEFEELKQQFQNLKLQVINLKKSIFFKTIISKNNQSLSVNNLNNIVHFFPEKVEKVQESLEISKNIISLFMRVYENGFAMTLKFPLLQFQGRDLQDHYNEIKQDFKGVDALWIYQIIEKIFSESIDQASNQKKNLYYSSLFDKIEYSEKCRSKKHMATYFFLMIALEFNLDFVDLIDENYFSNKQLLSDQQIQYELNGLLREREEYSSGMLIFDLSSLARIKKVYSDQQEDLKCPSAQAYKLAQTTPGFHYEIHSPQTYQTILNKISQHFHNKILKNDKKRLFFVVISDWNKLTLEFKEECNWMATPNQEKIEMEIEQQCTEELFCARCKQHYFAKDNNSNACSKHLENKFYRESEYKLITDLEGQMDSEFYKAQENKQQKLSIDQIYDHKIKLRIMINNLLETNLNYYSIFDVQQQIKNNPLLNNDFQYVCCGKKLEEPGEIKCEHITKEQLEQEILNQFK